MNGTTNLLPISDEFPIPEATEMRGGGHRKFPYYELEVGQSFFVPEAPYKRIATSMSGYNKELAPKRFTARAMHGGVRVWRIA